MLSLLILFCLLVRDGCSLPAAPPLTPPPPPSSLPSPPTPPGAKEDERLCLKFRLLGHGTNVSEWGHEYVRHLAGEVGAEWESREASEPPAPTDDLLALVKQVVPYHCAHNAEPEAVDLLLEVGLIGAGLLEQNVDSKNYTRTCLYLTSCAAYLSEAEAEEALRTAYNIYIKVGRYTDALRTALRMDSDELVHQAFAACADPL